LTEQEKIRVNNMKDITYRLEGEEKRYFLRNKEIGIEYDVVRLLINQGMSSSHAHKVIKKVKEMELG